MIVSIEVHHHLGGESYWQLTRCHLQITSVATEVGVPALYRAMHFGALEETIRYAKALTFTYLMNREFKEMPEHMEWRVIEEDQMVPCPACQQPMYRKAKLHRTGTSLDLNDWGCPRCKQTVTLTTEGLR
jgi:hypothetical protein